MTLPMPSGLVDPTLLAARSLQRLLPRLEDHYSDYAAACPQEWQSFITRLESSFPRLFGLLLKIYGSQYDFFYHLEALLDRLAHSWVERPPELKELDAVRESNPTWFQSNSMVGAVGYVDLFAGNLEGVRAKLPYFKELGITYLHLMPFFCCPEGENDGGYAISSYREVDPKLGTMDDLRKLADELRQNGISLVVDFVFNHTSDEHVWARQAKAGDVEAMEYYRMFPDRQIPDAYECTLREIFPDEHPGAFTFVPEINRWVWTTFHRYQWDLNYANPEVFIRMAEEMLFLANTGVEVLRLDAVAFIWKQMGTTCENLPEAHELIQAFNAVARIAAPALVFKSEAIVHPDEVARYINPEECQISYNPLLMALLWESLATREVKLLNESLRERFRIPPGCGWVNYVRCHDDIGWTFSDEDAARLDVNGFYHRQFLNRFYTGRFAGSFARGLPFQENPKTGDCRISGTCASLAGLEKAELEETEREVDLAIRRVLLIHGLILTIGGIPLIYLGDEIGTLNDYSFSKDPAKMRDSRWVHRPFADAERYERRTDPGTPEGRIYTRLRQLIALRKETPGLSGQEFQVIDTGDPHVFGFLRSSGSARLIVLANFSEETRTLPANLLRLYGISYGFHDLLTSERFSLREIPLEAYQLRVLQEDGSTARLTE
jgi:amylosucrase